MLLVACLLPALSIIGRPATSIISRPRALSATMSAVDTSKTFRAAQFWEEETATLLDIANVLGRWDSASDWVERTEFSVVEVTRDESMAQSATLQRYSMAQRMGAAERVAMLMNVPKLPFKDEKLAAYMGRTVAQMDAMPVSAAALGIVYDALAQSKSGLIPLKTIDERAKALRTAEGGLDEGALAAGLYKSRAAVTVGFILLGKGQLYGAVVVARVLLDATGAFDAVQAALGPVAEPLYWILSFGVAAYAVQQSMAVYGRTSNFKRYSKAEAEAEEARLLADPDAAKKKSTTVFERLGKKSE